MKRSIMRFNPAVCVVAWYFKLAFKGEHEWWLKNKWQYVPSINKATPQPILI